MSMRIFKKSLFIALFAFAFIVVQSCKHDSVVPDIPISFSQDVAPVIGSQCGDAGCHGTSNPEEIELITYRDVMEIVKPGNPDDSKIIKVMMQSFGEDMMPPSNRPRVPDEQIKIIYGWILQGALDN